VIKAGGQKGQILVFVALSLAVLLAIVGLAIDVGVAYGVKAKLSAAVDAAAIAAGNALSGGASQSTAQANAIAAADNYFSANYPKNYLGSTASLQQPNFPTSATPGQTQINVAATATVPTYFLRVLGVKQLTVSTSAQATKRDIDLVLVVDNTGSMASNGPAVISAVKSFVEKFNPNPGGDRLALINFAVCANVLDPITTTRGFDLSKMENQINGFTFNGWTNYSEAFDRAIDQLQSIPSSSRSSLRVIVFFSDGSPNSFSSTFPYKIGNRPSTQLGVITSGTDGIHTGDPNGIWYVGPPQGPAFGGRNGNSLAGESTSVTFPLSGVTVTLPQYFGLINDSGYTDANLFAVSAPPTPQLASYRPVVGTALTGTQGFYNVDNTARNLPEEMANYAQTQGIYVFTIGMDDFTDTSNPMNLLTHPKGWGNGECGNAILMNMANDPSSVDYNPNLPVGGYYYAGGGGSGLQAAFNRVASQILSLTQ